MRSERDIVDVLWSNAVVDSGTALLSPQSVTAIGGGSHGGLAMLERALLVPLAEAGVLLAIVGGTLSVNRHQRNLAAAVTGLLGAFVILRMTQII